MHFSVLAEPKDHMKVRFRHALEGCGYDVFHGCVTAFIGVALLSCVPSESCRVFGFTCMFMTVNGGFYSLCGLPSAMSLYESASFRMCSSVPTPQQATVLLDTRSSDDHQTPKETSTKGGAN